MAILKKTFMKNCQLALKQHLSLSDLAIVNAFRDDENLEGLRQYLTFSREDVQVQTIYKMVTDLNQVVSYCAEPTQAFLGFFEREYGLGRELTPEQRLLFFFPDEPDEPPDFTVFDYFLALCRVLVTPYLVVDTSEAHNDEATTNQSRNTCRIYFRPDATWVNTPEGQHYLRERDITSVREHNFELLTLDALYNHVTDLQRTEQQALIEEKLEFFDLRATLHLSMSVQSGVTRFDERLQEDVPYDKYLSTPYCNSLMLQSSTESMLRRWMSLLIYDNDSDNRGRYDIMSNQMIKFQQKLSDEGYTFELNPNQRNSPLGFDSDLIEHDLELHEFFFTLRLKDIWNSDVDFYTLILLTPDEVASNVHQDEAISETPSILFNFDRVSRQQQIRNYHQRVNALLEESEIEESEIEEVEEVEPIESEEIRIQREQAELLAQERYEQRERYNDTFEWNDEVPAENWADPQFRDYYNTTRLGREFGNRTSNRLDEISRELSEIENREETEIDEAVELLEFSDDFDPNTPEGQAEYAKARKSVAKKISRANKRRVTELSNEYDEIQAQRQQRFDERVQTSSELRRIIDESEEASRLAAEREAEEERVRRERIERESQSIMEQGRIRKSIIREMSLDESQAFVRIERSRGFIMENDELRDWLNEYRRLHNNSN